MPALPWSTRRQVDNDRQYTAMASRLPLKSFWSLPGFMRDTLRIRRQLTNSPGLVGYSLNAHLFGKTFWTFSVWESEDALRTFSGTDPHRTIITQLRPKMDTTKFEFFSIAGSEVPLAWEQIIARTA
jgi:hypothetical protein